MYESPTLVLAGVLLLGALIQWFSWWVKLPAILGLLVAGVVLGPVTGFLDPDLLLGEQLFTFVSLGVAIVLFEGALTLRFSDIRGHGSSVTNLVTWGAVVSWLVMGAGVYFATELSASIALLFAALVVVTGPTVIVPLLRTVRPNQNVSNILRWEGILIDPLGALFAVFMFEWLAFGAGSHSVLVFVKELMVGIVFGCVAAAFVAYIMRRHLLPEYLQNVFILGMVLTVFAGSNYFGEEAGLVAVTVMGVWLANTKLDIQEVLSFKETLSVIIITVLFIFLAARIQFSELAAIAPMAIPVLLVVLLARPLVIALCTIGSSLTWREKALIAWIAPRGIVAAAVSSLFAIKLSALNYPGAELLPALTFMVIVVTVLLQSITARPLARWLGVAEEEPRGVLIIGANAFARELGKALQGLGFRVKLASMTWADIQAVKMDGLSGYLGNPVSVHADQNLDLVGIGYAVAISRRPELNALASMKYRNELGRQAVFSLGDNTADGEARTDDPVTANLRTPRLFGSDITLDSLLETKAQGGAIKVTAITETFSEQHYQEHYGERATILAVVDEKQRIYWAVADKPTELRCGCSVVALVSDLPVAEPLTA